MDDLLFDSAEPEKIKPEALLSENLFGRPLSQTIGELEFSNQVNVTVINAIIKKTANLFTTEEIEDMKKDAVSEINKKYGFDLLAYIPPKN